MNYAITTRVSMYADVSLVVGVRPIQSSVMYAYELRGTDKINAQVFSINKGDALGLNLGVQYRLGD